MKLEVIYQIKLPMFLIECPLWWKNFTNDVPGDELAARLDEYKAKIYRVNSEDETTDYWILEFESTNEAIVFKLKWS